ncbi:hypothetical protein GVX82_02755 [Patescibacteria group bacterium]|jgi:copper oxidase (laccase) domain-containing protein|nr:hypothetical protein [Patescibacteria group bacterium]
MTHAPTAPGLDLWFTDHSDGNLSFAWGATEEVRARRHTVLAQAGSDPSRAVVMQCRHEDVVVRVDREDGGRGVLEGATAPVAEALLTQEPDLTLCLLTADCVPLVLTDRERSLLLLAHVGRMPLARGLVEKCVAVAGEVALAPLEAHLGPGIYPSSYVLPDSSAPSDPVLTPFTRAHGPEAVRVDLFGAIRAELTRAGIASARIYDHSYDTAATEQQFSHYRAVRTGEPEGRFMTLARLTGEVSRS